MPHTARSRRLFLTGVLVLGFSTIALTGSGLVLPASLADAVSVGRSGGMMGLVTRSLATTARNCGWQQAEQRQVLGSLPEAVQAGGVYACLCWEFVSPSEAFLAVVLYACLIAPAGGVETAANHPTTANTTHAEEGQGRDAQQLSSALVCLVRLFRLAHGPW